jgi:hypothetical protein
VPFQLNTEDAYRRERFLKTGKGKRHLKNRLVFFLLETNNSRSNVLVRDKLERR